MPQRRADLAAMLGWGALVLLIAIAAYLMLYACGLRLFDWQILNCPSPAAIITNPPADRLDDLQRQVRDAERALREGLVCRAEGTAPTTLPAVREALAPGPACTEERAEGTTNVIILDGSRSMLLPYTIPLERDREMHERLARSRAGGLSAEESASIQEEFNRATSGTSGRRIDVARDMIVEALEGTSGSISAVVFEDCTTIDSVNGVAAVKARVQGLTPRGGTPIAEAINRAARLIPPGANGRHDGNIILVTDGAESCNGDPCGAAKLIRQRQPGTVINVVDAAGWTDIACVARETGGFVRRGGGTVDLKPLLKDAIKRRATEGCGETIERPR